jgi:hypothetical protein
MTVGEELVERVINVFAVRLKLESPFVSTSPACIRAFLLPKISGSNRFYPDCLQRYIENVNKKQALPAPATCTMINGLIQRVMAFFASCEQLRYSKRFDSWNENISILTSYMGGDYRSWRKVQ